MVSGWKSGAWRMTVSETICAKPSSRRPITFIGKTHGKVRREGVWGLSCWLMIGFIPGIWGRKRGASSRDRAPGAQLGLVVLEERVHAPEDRSRLAAADRFAVEGR